MDKLCIFSSLERNKNSKNPSLRNFKEKYPQNNPHQKNRFKQMNKRFLRNYPLIHPPTITTVFK